MYNPEHAAPQWRLAKGLVPPIPKRFDPLSGGLTPKCGKHSGGLTSAGRWIPKIIRSNFTG